MREAMQATAAAMSCEVTLEGIEVEADIGAYEHEFGKPQPLTIDVAVTITPPVSDDLRATFDYAEISGFALELARQRIALLETFVKRLAGLCLAHPAALAVEVRIGKPRAVPACMAGVRVRLVKGRPVDKGA